MDWEQDAALLFPAVNKAAGFEVRTCPYMHWWTFMSYYMEIGESLFASVINIRLKKSKGKKLEKEAQEFQRKYENNGFVSPERAQQEYQRIQKQQQDLQALQQKLTEELALENQKNSLQLRDSINSFLKIYNQDKGYDLIISNTGFDNLLYANPAFNITNEIVEGLNNRYTPSATK